MFILFRVTHYQVSVSRYSNSHRNSYSNYCSINYNRQRQQHQQQRQQQEQQQRRPQQQQQQRNKLDFIDDNNILYLLVNSLQMVCWLCKIPFYYQSKIIGMNCLLSADWSISAYQKRISIKLEIKQGALSLCEEDLS